MARPTGGSPRGSHSGSEPLEQRALGVLVDRRSRQEPESWALAPPPAQSEPAAANSSFWPAQAEKALGSRPRR